MFLTESLDLKPSEKEGYTHEIPADQIYLIDPTARDFITQCFKADQKLSTLKEHAFLKADKVLIAESEALPTFIQVRALRSLCVKSNSRNRELADQQQRVSDTKASQICLETAKEIVKSNIDFTLRESVLRALKPSNTHNDLQKAVDRAITERDLELSDSVFTVVQRKDSVDTDDIIALLKTFKTTFKEVMPSFDDSLHAIITYAQQSEGSPDCILRDEFHEAIVTKFFRASEKRHTKFFDSSDDRRSIFSNQDKLCSQHSKLEKGRVTDLDAKSH